MERQGLNYTDHVTRTSNLQKNKFHTLLVALKYCFHDIRTMTVLGY